MIPLTKRFVRQDKRIFARGALAVVPKPAASKIATVDKAICSRAVPNLNLRIPLQIDSAVGSFHRFIVDHQFVIGVVAIGYQVGALAVVDQFIALDTPVLRCFLQPLVLLLSTLSIAHGGQLAWIKVRSSVPAIQVLAVENQFEAVRHRGCLARYFSKANGSTNKESRQHKAKRVNKTNQ